MFAVDAVTTFGQRLIYPGPKQTNKQGAGQDW